MDPNDYPKGSYLNPYTEEEHQTKKRSGSWCGGWLKEEDNSLVYYSSNDVTSTNHGLKAAPYDYGVYTDLLTYGQWLGGWVGSYPGNVCYYTENNTQYYDDDYVFGSENYPVPVDVYTEMCRLGLWNFGWVKYDDDHDPYYVDYSISNNSNGCGCGCGSGEGSGSEGSGSNASFSPGSAIIGNDENVTILLSWNSTPIFHLNILFDRESICGAEAFAANNDLTVLYVIQSMNIAAVWDGEDRANVSGSFSYLKIIRICDKNTHEVVGNLYLNRTINVGPGNIIMV